MKKVKKWIRKNKAKLIIFNILFIAIILAIIVTFMKIQNKKYKYTIEDVSNYNYYLFYENGKAGVIDTEGNIIISPIYYNVQIPNPSKPIFICLSDYNLEDGTYKSKVLNEKQEEILNNYEKIESLPISGTVSSIPYEKSILKYKKDEKYGLITFEGQVITKPIYDEIKSLKYKEGQLLVKEAGKYGVINQKGEKLIACKYDDIIGDSFYTEENKYSISGYIVCVKTQDGYKYGYITNNGKVLLNTEYNQLYRLNQMENKKDAYLIARKDGKYGLLKNNKIILEFDNQNINYDNKVKLLKVEKNDKFGVYDISGKQILERRYKEVAFKGIYIQAKINEEELYFDKQGNLIQNVKYSLVNNTKNDNYYITVNNEGLYGIINKDEEVLIENKYNYLEYTYGNYFIAYNNENKLGVIDEYNNEIVGFKYDVLSKLENSNILQGKILNKNIIELYSKTMQNIGTFEHAIVLENKNYIEVFNGEISQYFDKDGKELTNKDVIKETELYAKEKDGKYGFVDAKDNIKVECIYDGVTEFNKYGFAGIKQNGKWGVINKNGEIIQEPIYTLRDTETIPEFIGKYYKVKYEYGQMYYTNKVKE